MITTMQSGGSVMEDTIFTVRYAACLLTSLVRKMPGSNPNEVETMISKARIEAQKGADYE